MMSKHPVQARLALFASADLSRFARWNIERHLASCDDCRRDVADFSALRSEMAEAGELPALYWNRLAAEMKANIRLGLVAGECVSQRPASRFVFSPRALAACASLVLLVAVGFFLERPVPQVSETKKAPGAVILEASHSGIQVTEGEQSMMLLNTNARDVNVVASGGTMRARYVDSDTGYVTINNVYVQ